MEHLGESVNAGVIFKTGNLLDSDCQCLINTVNTVGVMGKGIALEFKKKYPHMFEVYKLHCMKGSLNTGQVMFYRQKPNPLFVDDKIICLFPTKEHWRNPSRIEYIESGLKAFIKYYPDWKIESVAFPKLGCGNGGLDWEHHIKPLMIGYLEQLPIRVEIYE
jgi:O-acetyl-ADP-ribose deacetylase (regulator of RNase III)